MSVALRRVHQHLRDSRCEAGPADSVYEQIDGEATGRMGAHVRSGHTQHVQRTR